MAFNLNDVTRVSYNGYNFGMIKTSSFSVSPMYDGTGLDVIGYENKLVISFVLAIRDKVNIAMPGDDEEFLDAKMFGDLIGTEAEFNKAVTFRADDLGITDQGSITRLFNHLKRILEVPRRHLVVERGGEKVFDNSKGLGNGIDTVDDFGGPFPGELTVLAPISNQTWILQWSVTWKTINSERSEPKNGAPIPVSIRYDQEQSWDERGYSTITTTGELKSTSPIFKGGNVAVTLATVDSLRNLTLPVLLPGYRRRSRFKVGRDGMSLAFTFVDRQLHVSPPDPSVEADGHYAIYGSGAIWHSEISVTLSGAKETPKQKLLEAALMICLSRVKKVASPINGFNQRELWQTMFAKSHGGIAIKEKLFDNVVSVSMRFLIPPSKTKLLKAQGEDNGEPTNFSRAAEIGLQALPGIASVGGHVQMVNAIRHFLTGNPEKAANYAGRALDNIVGGTLGFIPIVGPAVAMYKLNNFIDSEAAKREEKRRAQEQDNADAIFAGAVVPHNAIGAVGADLPGVQKRDFFVDAGGLRGNDVTVPVLLVAGIMRDPAINPQRLLLNKRGTGVLGPVIPFVDKAFETPPTTWNKDHDEVGYVDYSPKANGAKVAGVDLRFVENFRTSWWEGVKDLINHKPSFWDNIRQFIKDAEVPDVQKMERLKKKAEIEKLPYGLNKDSFSDGVTVTQNENGFSTSPAGLSDGMDVYYDESYDLSQSVFASYNGETLIEDSKEESLTPYSVYQAEVDYNFIGNKVVAYPTGTGTPVVARLLQKPTAQVVVRVAASRIGAPPVVPITGDNSVDPNLVFERSSITMQHVDVGDDGSLVYTVKGYAVYKVVDPDKLVLRPPVPPWVEVDMGDMPQGALMVKDELKVTDGNII